MKSVSIVIPVYNEALGIDLLYRALLQYLPDDFEIIWVDDGSTDNSIEIISTLSLVDNRVKALSFSRNFGHQAALIAGLKFACKEYIIIMDGDLQHPPSILPEFIKALDEGFDIVSGRRVKTEKSSLYKRLSSKLYYKTLNILSEIPIEENIADFRGFNRKVLHALHQFDEKEMFLRGIFGWVGFKKKTIDYESPERPYGKSKYTKRKMVRLGIRGITSFAFKPLRMALIVGLITFVVSFIMAVYAVVVHLSNQTVRGWTSLIITVMFFGGVQLLFLGVIGEYLASLFTEVKKRPSYLINQTVNLEQPYEQS